MIALKKPIILFALKVHFANIKLRRLLLFLLLILLKIIKKIF